jgi:hypothetical protein
MTQHHKLKYQRNETIVSRLDVLVHDTLQRPPTIEEHLVYELNLGELRRRACHQYVKYFEERLSTLRYKIEQDGYAKTGDVAKELYKKKIGFAQ